MSRAHLCMGTCLSVAGKRQMSREQHMIANVVSVTATMQACEFSRHTRMTLMCHILL